MLDRPVLMDPVYSGRIFWAVRLGMSMVSRCSADRADKFAQLRTDNALRLGIAESVTDDETNIKQSSF